VFTVGGAVQLQPGTSPFDVVAVDLDGDGALDLAVLESGALAWFHNDGAAHFTRVAGAFPAGQYTRLEFVDIDEDGDLDLYAAGSPIALLTNDGTGLFTDATARLWSTSFGPAKFADVDEDGDVDLVALVDNAWRRVPDRTRGAESLQVVHAGGGMQVRFYVQPQSPVPGALVLPMVALGPGPSTAIPASAAVCSCRSRRRSCSARSVQRGRRPRASRSRRCRGCSASTSACRASCSGRACRSASPTSSTSASCRRTAAARREPGRPGARQRDRTDARHPVADARNAPGGAGHRSAAAGTARRTSRGRCPRPRAAAGARTAPAGDGGRRAMVAAG